MLLLAVRWTTVSVPADHHSIKLHGRYGGRTEAVSTEYRVGGVSALGAENAEKRANLRQLAPYRHALHRQCIITHGFSLRIAIFQLKF